MNIPQALLGCCVLASLPLHAAPAFNPVELSDQELAQLRGRYVLPGHVVHFGITMTSAWENAGQRLDASVSLQAQQGMARPLLTVTANGNGDQGNAPAAGSGTIIGGQGLNTVDGISQSVRTAGDINTAQNDISINISRNGQAPALNRSGTPLNGEFSTQTSLGNAKVHTTPNGGLQVAIQTNGQGNSLQQLGGGLRQSVDIISSNNLVRNLTHLDVVLKENRTSLEGLNCNLDQLRGLRPTGY